MESLILRSSSIEELDQNISPELLLRIVSPEEVEHILKLAEAFWVYQGEPCAEKPHALLHSGKHSNGFVMVGPTIKKHAGIRALFAHSLVMLVSRNSGAIPSPAWVTGADTSSTDLAGDVARFFNAYHVKMVKVELEGGKKTQAWRSENQREFSEIGYYGLQVEELITTAASALEVREGLRQKAAGSRMIIAFADVLPTIVNRSDPRKPIEEIDGSTVLSLLRLKISNYESGPEFCPYCAAGSEAIKPKEGDNWKRLAA